MYDRFSTSVNMLIYSYSPEGATALAEFALSEHVTSSSIGNCYTFNCQQ